MVKAEGGRSTTNFRQTAVTEHRGGSVRKSGGSMAGQDRRVRRTRRLIGDAFVALILERGYERITVQDILDRADVGRSTFYTHYRDKEAVLTAAFDDMHDELRADLAVMPPGVPPDPTGPAGAIFDHAYRHRAVYQALCGRQGGSLVHRHLRHLIGGLLREHLRSHLTAAGSDLPVDVVAEFYTSAALGLLAWWVDSDFPHGPTQLTHMYRRLAAPGLLTALGHDVAVRHDTPRPGRTRR
jgi:AcrR family transcriptional regulator